jgi:hypothetical protein
MSEMSHVGVNLEAVCEVSAGLTPTLPPSPPLSDQEALDQAVGSPDEQRLAYSLALFPLLEARLNACNWSGSLGLRGRITEVMHLERILAAREAIASHAADSEWTASTKKILLDFWRQYNATSITFMCAALGVPVTGRPTKDQLMDLLVQNKFSPLPWAALDVYSTGYQQWQVSDEVIAEVISGLDSDAQPNPLEAQVPELTAVTPPPTPEQQAAAWPALVAQAAAVPAAVPANHPPVAAQQVTETEVAGAVAADPMALHRIMASLINQSAYVVTNASGALQAARTANFAGTQMPVGQLQTPWAMVKSSALTNMLHGQYVEPVLCDDITRDYLMFKAPFAGEQLSIDRDGMIKTARGSRLPDVANVFTAHRIKQGYQRLIQWVLEDPRFEATLAMQMLQLYNKVFGWPHVSEQAQATYFKHFLLKHAGSKDLLKDQRDDTELIYRFLVVHTGGMQSSSSSASSSSSSASSSSASSSSAARPRGSKRSSSALIPRGSAATTAAAPMRVRSEKPCFSRVDLNATCAYSDCVFSHACASCGRDHPASACPSWDAAKGAAAAAAMNRGRRGSGRSN